MYTMLISLLSALIATEYHILIKSNSWRINQWKLLLVNLYLTESNFTLINSVRQGKFGGKRKDAKHSLANNSQTPFETN